MGRRVVRWSPRGKMGIMASCSSTELSPELSSPIITTCGGFHPAIDACRTSRTGSRYRNTACSHLICGTA
eukprot:3284552-Rhodomonas_salina.2